MAYKKRKTVISESAIPDEFAQYGMIPQSEDQYEVILPSGYKIICQTKDEYDYCTPNIQPYLDRQEDVPEDYWVVIHIQMTNYLNMYRVDKMLARPGIKPDEQAALLQQRHKLLGSIQEFARRLDPLKLRKRVEGLTAVEFLENQREIAREYAKEHIGEFTWKCPHCSGINLMEVPHFAYDSAAGTKAIFNRQVFELIRKHYVPNDSDLKKKYSGSLSVKDAAAVLGISPIGILAIALPEERNCDLGIKYNLDNPDSFAKYVEEE